MKNRYRFILFFILGFYMSTIKGIFYNPYAEANMEGRIEFTNLVIETDEENTPYSDYGGH